MAHEQNVTKPYKDKNGKILWWYNEIGKKPGTKHSPHPRHLNKRYMKTFKTKSAAVKEAKSISASYDKKSKKKN